MILMMMRRRTMKTNLKSMAEWQEERMTSTFFVLSSICCSTQTDLSPASHYYHHGADTDNGGDNGDDSFGCHTSPHVILYLIFMLHIFLHIEATQTSMYPDKSAALFCLSVLQQQDDDANRGLSKRPTINFHSEPETTISCQKMSF